MSFSRLTTDSLQPQMLHRQMQPGSHSRVRQISSCTCMPTLTNQRSSIIGRLGTQM